MKIEYVWIMGLCVIISTIISLLLIRKYIQWLLLYSAKVSAALIEYYEASDEEEKESWFDEVANALATDFGTNFAAREWLVRKCNEEADKCDGCLYWTCPGKEKINIESEEKGNET